MIEHLQTLKALFDHKTMHKAATALRVSQPTVSKRIALLEHHLGKELIQKSGRNVELTSEGVRLLEQVHPHLLAVKSILNAQPNTANQTFHAGFSESVLIAFGGEVLSALRNSATMFKLIPHAHRSPVVLDRVMSGEYSFGVCAGSAYKVGDCHVEKLCDEPMVLMNEGLEKDLMGIEQSSETQQSIERKLKKQSLSPQYYLESYAAMVKLAQKKLFRAVVPIGICKAFGVSSKQYKKLEISRPLIFVARKNVYERDNVKQAYRLIKAALIKSLN